MAHVRSFELTMFLIDKCHLDCVYCYPGDYKENKRSISKDFAFYAIDRCIGNGITNKIRFYAVGEPTLNFRLMREVHDYAVAKYTDLLFELQTSGVFNHLICDWIGQHINTVWISCDGPPDIQDRQRPLRNGGKTYHIIERNIQSLLRQKTVVGIRPTVTPYSFNKLSDIVHYAVELGVRYIYFHPAIKQQGKTVKNWSLQGNT